MLEKVDLINLMRHDFLDYLKIFIDYQTFFIFEMIKHEIIFIHNHIFNSQFLDSIILRFLDSINT